MQLTAKLKDQVLRAARTSMRIEGYATVRSREVQEKAKLLMEQQRVQVSVQSK